MNFRRRCTATIAAAAILCAPIHAARAADTPVELDSLIKRHSAARDSIRSSYCTVEFNIKWKSVKGEIKQSCNGKYWYDRGSMRLEADEGRGPFTEVWKDSVRRALTSRGNGDKTEMWAGIDGFAVGHMHRGDAWVRGQLIVNLPGTNKSVPFEKLFEHGGKFVKFWDEAVDGKKYPTARVAFPASEKEQHEWKIDVQFDPSVNYLIRKTVHYVGRTPASADYARQETVVKFIEPLPGIYFPEVIEGKFGSGPAEEGYSKSVLGAVRINVPFPDSTFKIKYPHGIYVTDGLQNTRYRVDADGKPISKPEPLVKSSPPPAPAPSEQADRPTETVEEPRSTTQYWILGIAIALLSGTFGFALYRRIARDRR